MTKTRKKKLNALPVGYILICILPALSLTFLFTIYPALHALVMSFTNTGSLAFGMGDFVGLANYIHMFTNDIHFITALQNTLQLLAVVPAVTVFFALIFAFALTLSKLREKAVYRVLFFFPSVLSLVVVAVVWAALLGPRASDPLNRVLGWFGADPVLWLGDVRFSLWAIAIVMIWQAVGYYMVLLISSVDSINKDIFEAADIDGAGAASKLFRITVPLVKDSIGRCYVLALSGTLTISFILTHVMTGGGPGTSTLVLLGHIFNTGFEGAAFGYSMAVAMFTLAMALTFSIISRKISAGREGAA